MRRVGAATAFVWGIVLFTGTVFAQCDCGYPVTCARPCPRCAPRCEQKPAPREMPPVERGFFVAPPRNGADVGESTAVGVEGFGIHFPALTLRMPTIQLPSLVQIRRRPRMLIDAAEAPFVNEVPRAEFGIETEPQRPRGLPPTPRAAPTPRGAECHAPPGCAVPPACTDRPVAAYSSGEPVQLYVSPQDPSRPPSPPPPYDYGPVGPPVQAPLPPAKNPPEAFPTDVRHASHVQPHVARTQALEHQVQRLETLVRDMQQTQVQLLAKLQAGAAAQSAPSPPNAAVRPPENVAQPVSYNAPCLLVTPRCLRQNAGPTRCRCGCLADDAAGTAKQLSRPRCWPEIY